jgi:hypothetical protein
MYPQLGQWYYITIPDKNWRWYVKPISHTGGYLYRSLVINLHNNHTKILNFNMQIVDGDTCEEVTESQVDNLKIQFL